MNSLLETAKAVIFDADGLLIDSEPLWDKTREEFAHTYGKEVTAGFHDRFRGMGMKEVLTRLQNEWNLPGEVPSLIQEFRETFYSLALGGELKLMPGTEKLIKELVEKGKKLAVATGGHTQEKMMAILERFGLATHFDLVISSDQVQNGKPAPDIFLFTASQLQLPKEQCVIVEDAVNGIQAAKAAGMTVIGVQRDDAVRKQLEENNADITVTSLEELV